MRENLRQDFPLLQLNPDLTYLDSAATSLKPQVVLDKINEYYTQYGVNIHRGVYDLSNTATIHYDEARHIVATFIGAKDEEVIFTKGTTNSLNMLAEMLKATLHSGDEVIATVLEHHSSIMPWQVIVKELGIKLIYADLDAKNRFTKENFEKVLTKNTKVVLVPYISNVLGTISEVKEIAKLAHEKGVIVICDAAQAAPHIKIDVKDLDVDFLAFSGHKMLSPTGVGVLYGKKHYLDILNPAEFGGDMNDGVSLYEATYKDAPSKFEAGTPNIEGVIGLGEAVKYLESLDMNEVFNHSKALASYVYEALKDEDALVIYTKGPESGIFTFNIKGIHPHDAATFLATKGICVRAGHHCAQLITNYLGCIGNVRASFYIYNTMDDAKALVKAIKEAIQYFKEWL